MKKWLYLVPILLTLLYFLMGQNQQAPLESLEAASPLTLTSSQELVKTQIPVLTPVPRVPSSRSPQTLRERMDPLTPLVVGRRSYKLHESLVAMEAQKAIEQGIKIQQTLGAWALVDLSDAPPESYPVLRRSGSGELGVFRGVLKTMSLDILSENGAWSQCPGSLLSSNPEIKIYLFEANSELSPEEMRQCLDETRLFSRLEWEILDQPRLSR